ncbi:MAG: DUF1294 domain-containing protein [Anaerolineaceae bacterium]|nr:DUF1294 domain-containing protein [Anaerolineaceae bacterium]
MFSYYLVINVVTFLAWGFDKFRAQLQQWRVPEKTLYGLIILGGGVGALLGMTVFRHKTRKTQFKVIALISIVVHLFIFFYLFQ